MKVRFVLSTLFLLTSLNAFSVDFVVISCPGLAGQDGNIKISDVQIEIAEAFLMEHATSPVENGALIAIKGRNTAFGTDAIAYSSETATYSSLRSSIPGTEEGDFVIASVRVSRVAKAGKKIEYSAYVFEDDRTYNFLRGMKSVCKVIPRRTIRN